MSRAERRQWDIERTTEIVGNRDGWHCVYCGCTDRSRLQLAHIFPKDKRHLEEYGERVIHHPENLKMTCDKCNYKAEIDPKTRPVEAAKHIAWIIALVRRGDYGHNG